MSSQIDPLFSQWQTYEKLVKNDHMDHQSFFGSLADQVRNQFSNAIRILDLGCGDCSPVEHLLATADVSHYKGVDESEAALALARVRLTSLNLTHSLEQHDMLAGLSEDSEQYDLIISSYALHHLNSQRKAALLDEAAQRLRPDGMMAVIDIFRRNGEPRQAYLAAWMQNARQRYTSLTPGELDLLFAHVRQRDFPESPNRFSRLARNAGFDRLFWSMSRDGELAGIVTMRR